MSVIVLLDADDADDVHIIQSDDFNNLVFATVDAADLWLQKNAKNGWCTRIIDLDD